MATVLIIGGQGRIGGAIAQDILRHTDATITVTRRTHPPQPPPPSPRLTLAQLDVNDTAAVQRAIATHDLVIDCAGPFHHRNTQVLQQCIEAGVNYLDVSDCAPFSRRALPLHDAAQQANVTAIINTGVFPGISNGMARWGVEAFEQQFGRSPHSIRLYYGVAGSGGAGVTVMRTTFLGLQHPVTAWIDGQWRELAPYSDRQVIQFPPPIGTTGVYWYEVAETLTLAQSFPVQTVVTKFGSVPDLYNRLTWAVAHWLPQRLLHNAGFIEDMSRMGYYMTQVSDRFSGTGIAMVVEITENESLGNPEPLRLTLVHEDTAIAAGAGTGSLAQLILSHQLQSPGVQPVETAVPTPLFQAMMQQRQIAINVTPILTVP
ncbi:MAG: saccharopine dehydrogenase NADP-binding domain-containing protein [Leptolyngbyaceae bacterium]|nr:saccharopine dehydrogenase NADP-binding domain-containing protein [Leptolyngbyaceae bacterium]